MSGKGNVLDLHEAYRRFEAELSLVPPDDDPEDPGWQPEDARDFGPAKPEESGPAFDHEGDWTVQTAADFTAGFVAPEYIVDGVIQRGRLYTLTAPTGSGKTAVMLYASTVIATGGDFAGREVESGDVLFLAGENPDDVRARVIATLDHMNIDPVECPVHFIAGTFSIRSDMAKLREAAARLPNLILIVIDTFAAYFDGDDENSNAQALDFARVARKLTAFPSRPAVIMPAHPVKNATRASLEPKGGSSLVNEVDGNLTLWNDDGILTLHWHRKFRGAEFEPLQFELEPYTSDLLKDRKGRLIPTVHAKPLMETRARQLDLENLRMEDKLLLNIEKCPAQSLANRAIELGLQTADGKPYKSKVTRMIENFAKQKLVRKLHRNWELTKDGERAVKALKSGDPSDSKGVL